MAVRNLEKIQRKADEIRKEQENLRSIRQKRIEYCTERIKSQKDVVIDALDTLYELEKQGFTTNTLNIHRSKEIHYKENLTYERTLEIYLEIEENRMYFYYNAERNEITSSTYGKRFRDWSWKEESDTDYQVLPLLETFAVKIEQWCQRIFDFTENL